MALVAWSFLPRLVVICDKLSRIPITGWVLQNPKGCRFPIFPATPESKKYKQQAGFKYCELAKFCGKADLLPRRADKGGDSTGTTLEDVDGSAA